MKASQTIQLLALFALGLAGVGVWLLFVWLRFRLRRPPGERLTTRASDGWPLSGRYRQAQPKRFVEPVLLAHGLSTNHLTFDFEPPYSLAHALNQAGFDTYAVDFRGAFESAGSPFRSWSVEDHIQQDAPAFLEKLLQRSGAPSAFWVGHSLGGLIGYGVASGDQADRLKGLVTIGSPVYLHLSPPLRCTLALGTSLAFPLGFRHRLTAKLLSPFLGYLSLPMGDALINPDHVPPHIQRQAFANIISTMGYRVLRQFRDWSRQGPHAWLRGVKQPVLILGGSADRLATSQGVTQACVEIGSRDKTLAIFGTARGDAQEYGHGDFLFGRGAPREVFPLIIRWLSERATPLR